MESSTSNNNINAIKDVGSFLMSLEVIFLLKKQRELEENSTKTKLPVYFLKKKSKMVLQQIDKRM